MPAKNPGGWSPITFRGTVTGMEQGAYDDGTLFTDVELVSPDGKQTASLRVPLARTVAEKVISEKVATHSYTVATGKNGGQFLRWVEQLA